MTVLCAILLGVAIAVAQALHGGLLVPALVIPSYGLLAVAGLPAIVAAFRNPTPPSPSLLIGVIIFIGYISWRCFQAPDRYLGRIEFGEALALGLAFMIGASALAEARSRFIFIGIILAMASAQAVCGFIQFAKGNGFAPLGWFSLDLQSIYGARFLTRARGFFLNPNQFAWLQGWATIFAVVIACWGRVNAMTRVVLIYLALVFLTADVLSGSRGGIASLLGGLIVFAVAGFVAVGVARKRGRGLVLVGSLALLLLCAGVGFAVYSTNYVVEGRFYALESEGFRSLLAEQAWRQFQVAPLMGMGPGTFIYAARLYRTGDLPRDSTFAHDDWLQTLAEYGFIGFALVLSLLVISLVSGFRRFFFSVKESTTSEILPFSNSTAILLASVCALVTFSIHSLTDFNMHVPANAMLAGATLGLLAGTGTRAAFASRRLQAGILRVLCAAALLVLCAGMTMFVGRYAQADYQDLLARNSLARSDIRSALAQTEAGLERQPRDVALLASRGRAFYEYESFLEIAGDEDSVAELSPLEQKRLYRSSADAYENALKWQPMERTNHAGLAKSLSQLGETRQTELQWLEAIRLDPMHSYAYSGYADYLYDKGDLPRALGIYSLASQLPDGQYAARRIEEVREEMSPSPEEETDADDEAAKPDENALPVKKTPAVGDE